MTYHPAFGAELELTFLKPESLEKLPEYFTAPEPPNPLSDMPWRVDSEGSLVKGKLENGNYGIKITPDKALRYEGTWVDGKLHGQGIIRGAHGNIRLEGEFKNGVIIRHRGE